MLNVIMLSVVMLNVVAPKGQTLWYLIISSNSILQLFQHHPFLLPYTKFLLLRPAYQIFAISSSMERLG
jgi:hypothetical protein